MSEIFLISEIVRCFLKKIAEKYQLEQKPK